MIAVLTIWPGYRLKQLEKTNPLPAHTTSTASRALTEEEQKRVLASLLPSRPVWPVVLSFTAFVYLWWLSILVFDLAFVWQRYVRQGAAFRILRDWSDIGKSNR